ncbi:predicted protein [Histoplasma capsulatum H143]|uniref:Uncharacterized protein n=1 Tax=Ajellomyces capsulatus (strain H143) TaxID=544712 RepID=C6HBD3_AJECH|nr:predicted protein [Histoplasma capsulatum H143]
MAPDLSTRCEDAWRMYISALESPQTVKELHLEALDGRTIIGGKKSSRQTPDTAAREDTNRATFRPAATKANAERDGDADGGDYSFLAFPMRAPAIQHAERPKSTA